MLYNTVEYSLSHNEYGTLIIEEPIGWSTDLKEIQRSTKNFSTITKYSTNLEFVKSGAKFITQVYSIYGLETSIILKKRVIHPHESEMVERYSAILDGYTYESEDGKVKISALESDLNAKLKAVGGDKTELETTEAFNGNNIGTLYKHRAYIEGKNLLFISRWDKKQDLFQVYHTHLQEHLKYAIPLNNYANSDDQAFNTQEPYLVQDGSNTYGYGNADQNACFYSIATHTFNANLTIDINIDVTATNEAQEIIDQLKKASINLDLVTFEDKSGTGGDQHTFLSVENLATFTGDSTTKNVTYYDRRTLNVITGRSYALVLRSDYTKDGIFTAVLNYNLNATNIVFEEQSHIDGSQSDVILPYELFNRLLQKITGRTDNIVLSDYFGRTDVGYDQDGAGAYLGIASGFYARQFKDRYLSTSWNEAIESYMVAANISYSIEKKGYSEYVRIEPLEYFFTQDKISLPNVVDDVKTSVANEYAYSSIDIGYEKGADQYEEAVGLDEFNGKHVYTTPLLRTETKFEKMSKYRADMTGFEFARRMPEYLFPTDDTDYDNDIFFLDLKTDGDAEILVQRFWADDYNSLPKNIYSPETASNLRISPKELLRRHGWFINNCLRVYPSDYIRFGSAIGNSQIELDGEKGSDNVEISSLEKSKFNCFFITFTYKTDYYLEQEISDKINGIIEFRDESGKVYQCRLIEFKDNKYKCLLINGLQ